MPEHESRWCRYSIEYKLPNGTTWSKAFARQVRSDNDINVFKQDCVRYFQEAVKIEEDDQTGNNKGSSKKVDLNKMSTTFKDGLTNQPPNTKSI